MGSQQQEQTTWTTHLESRRRCRAAKRLLTMMRKQQVVLAGMGRSEASTIVADFVRSHGNDIAFSRRILLVSTLRPHVVYIPFVSVSLSTLPGQWAYGDSACEKSLPSTKHQAKDFHCVRQVSAIENSQQQIGSTRCLQRVNGGYTLYLKNNKFPINATDKV